MKEQIKIEFEKFIKGTKLSKEYKELKRKNLNYFIEKGFPNKRDENWKFSDLNQIIEKNIKNLSFFENFSKLGKIDQSIYINDLPHNKLVFVNGKIEKIEFNFEEKNKIEIIDVLNSHDEKNNINSLISLNNAFVDRHFKLIVKKNYVLKKPLIIYNITSKNLNSKNLNLRTDIVLEENSSLRIINFFNDFSKNNFLNYFYDFKIGKNSILKNYKIDKVSNSNIKYFYNNINQEINSINETFILCLGSKFLKDEINCNLNGKYSSAFVNGIINLDKSQHHEIKTNINHLFENTKSYQLVKSVLNDESKSVFQGKIFVDSKAQKTDGYQLSKSILLSENSEFNAKPELEIYADDVKCSHGSASGNLDEKSIFYLMSRGLNYPEAKKLLINGFLLDVIENITDLEIKNLIKNIMDFKE